MLVLIFIYIAITISFLINLKLSILFFSFTFIFSLFFKEKLPNSKILYVEIKTLSPERNKRLFFLFLYLFPAFLIWIFYVLNISSTLSNYLVQSFSNEYLFNKLPRYYKSLYLFNEYIKIYYISFLFYIMHLCVLNYKYFSKLKKSVFLSVENKVFYFSYIKIFFYFSIFLFMNFLFVNFSIFDLQGNTPTAKSEVLGLTIVNNKFLVTIAFIFVWQLIFQSSWTFVNTIFLKTVVKAN